MGRFDEPATERQKEYARDLGLVFPDDISKGDISVLLDRKLDGDSSPNPDLMDFAVNRGMQVSPYIGKKALYNEIFATLTGVDRIAFFLFCVYRYCTDDRRGNLDVHPERAVIYKFAESLKDDEQFINSMNGYDGESIRYFGILTYTDSSGKCETHYGGRVDTIAYKRAVKLLSQKYNLKNKSGNKTLKKSGRLGRNTTARLNAEHEPVTSAKSRLITLILCIFTVCLHRFYVRKYGSAILYLFTCGLFGIGWIYDIVKICKGTFTDADGDYIETWFTPSTKTFLIVFCIIYVIGLLMRLFERLT